MTDTPPPELEAGRYDCPACDDRFETVGDKKRHIRDNHQENR